MNDFTKIVLLSFVIFLTACHFDPQKDLDNSKQKNNLPVVNAVDYYSEWSGHKVEYLNSIYEGLKAQGCENFVFYAGDSSLDNKHWIFQGKGKNDENNFFNDLITAPAVNGYEKLLYPPRMVKDVNYWMNYYLSKLNDKKICSIMTSVEASTLQEREDNLLKQDIFISEHITNNDYLVVSVAGNDLAALSRTQNINLDPTKLANSPFFKELLPFYKEKTEKFIKRILKGRKTKAVIISTLYYLDEDMNNARNRTAWPREILRNLSYDSDPKKLHYLIDLLHEKGTRNIRIEGVNLIPVKLSETLNGKDTKDYIQLVEPSSQGGQKMAQFFIRILGF